MDFPHDSGFQNETSNTKIDLLKKTTPKIIVTEEDNAETIQQTPQNSTLEGAQESGVSSASLHADSKEESKRKRKKSKNKKLVRISTSTPLDNQTPFKTPNLLYQSDIHFKVAHHSWPQINEQEPSLSSHRVKKSESPDVSPDKREWFKFVKASKNLSINEKLTKCIHCSNPARILQNIIMCTNLNCQLVGCSNCWDPICESVQYVHRTLENSPGSSNDSFKNMPTCSRIRKSQQDTTPQNKERRTIRRLEFSNSLDKSDEGKSPTLKNLTRSKSLELDKIMEFPEITCPKSICVYEIDEDLPFESPANINSYSIFSKKARKRLKRL